MDIPVMLRQALETGSCVLFIGAGMGYYMIDEAGNAIPDGNNLAKALAEKFNVPTGTSYDLTKISQYIEVKNKGRKELISFIRQILSTANPDENMMWIPSIKWKAIFTTNYDNVIQKAYDKHASPAQNYITISRSTGFKDFNSWSEVPIFHIHGALFEENSPDIVITQQDYIKYKEQRRMMFDYLKQQMATSCILYIGYSNSDSNWNLLISEIEEEFYPEKIQTSYRIDPFTSELDIELLKSRNIITICQKYDEFVIDANAQLTKSNIDRKGLEKLESIIPKDYINLYRENATPVLRLIKSWEYINQITSVDKMKPNLYDYVRGDKPSWGLVFEEMYFKRDIEDEIYDVLMDFATETRQRTKVCKISGSAGYGVSSLLMALAVRLVKDRAGKVFFHKYSNELREGDIFFALSDENEKCFFFIDNAADYTSFIRNTLVHVNENGKSIIFIVGDRINEWGQVHPTLRGDSFEIQPLSDSEIESLLDFLGDNNELNQLAYLQRDHQIAAIRKNYNRELLVAIREATEGTKIDAIIDDEFFGIKDEFSQKAYTYICCFNQHGSLLRVDLLAKLLEVSVVEFYEKVKGFLDGVIRYEIIDEERDEYAVRARHRLIAQIVWDRCVNNSIKDSIIHKALESLNILHRVDKEAFECFYKTDRFVDSLRNLESKIHFFERGCKKDPDNPYVRQHYARMYLRTGLESPALRIIDEAINMNNKIRVLYHTKGSILSCMIKLSENIEIGRRRLLQSEESFRTALKMDDRSEYCYQGLAELYLEWAKLVPSEEEKTLYINKAEEIINEGMKKSKEKEALWIESAKIDEFIGDNPSKLRSLEAAVKEAPGSIISRYLLAKAYNINEEYEKSLPILADLVKEYPDEYRPSIEYCKTILKTGGTLNEAIAVLQQSTLFGYSDAVYVATLGGLLFLNKDFTKAEKVFDESIRREFPNARNILFNPEDISNITSQFVSIVKYVGERHSYLFIPGFTDIICLSSKYNGISLQKGMKLLVSLVFTPMRAIAKIIDIL